MKLYFLLFISFNLVSCGKDPAYDSWKAPNLYISRADTKILANNEPLELDDYIYFSNDSGNLKIESIKTSKSDYTIKSETTCITNGRSHNFSNIPVLRSYIQLKEVLPPQALLTNDFSSCKIKLTLQNEAGSTKSFYISERNITLKSYKDDFQMNSKISYPNFQDQKISIKSNENLSLACDEFISNPMSSEASLTLADILFSHKLLKGDLDVKQYKPVQLCRLVLKSSQELRISNLFELQFQKLIPKYSYSIFRGHSQKRSGDRLFVYDLNIANSSEHPLSVGLNKNYLVLPFTRRTHSGSHNQDGDHYSNFTATAAISNSNQNVFIDKGAVLVIHLLPGESVLLQAFYDSACTNMTCVIPQASPNHLPIFNLEYNYRTRAEIEQATNIKLLDQLSVN